MHFCQLLRLHPEPELYLDDRKLKVVKETKFLGLIFDSKLSFRPHINNLRTSCLKKLNILRVLSSKNGEQIVLSFCTCIERS